MLDGRKRQMSLKQHQCFKKDGVKLHTIIDGHKHNDNMEKDVTPFPNWEQICHNVAWAKYRSKIDMSNVYEKIHVEPKDVWKTVFATIYGTFVSHTMQQGDCNTPATFQRLMTIIFQDYIRRLYTYILTIYLCTVTWLKSMRNISSSYSISCTKHIFI